MMLHLPSNVGWTITILLALFIMTLLILDDDED
jgi:hypothetical protein